MIEARRQQAATTGSPVPTHHPAPPMDSTTWAWDQCHWTTVCMCALYGIVFVGVCVQLVKIYLYKYKLMSFHTGFNLLVALWMLLRFLFFLSLAFPPMPLWVNRIMYWPTTNVQFATYSLLVCFFVSYVYREKWSLLVRKRVYFIYIFGNLALLTFTLSWIIIAGDRPESTATNAEIVSQILFTALIFLLITILMGVYGWMYISKMSDLQSRGKATGLPTGGTLTQVKVFYVVAIIIFSSRYIMDFTHLSYDFNEISFGIENKCLPSVTDFFVLTIWELVPTILLIVFFRSIPRTSTRFRMGNKSLATSLLRNQQGQPSALSSEPYRHRYTPLFSAPIDDPSDYSGAGSTFPGSNTYISGASVLPENTPNTNSDPWHEAAPAPQLLSYGSSDSSPSPNLM